MDKMRIVSVRNSYDVKVKRCCASCQHKCIEKDGTRFCALKMMVKLLELWLTQESRERVEKMLEYYHPLDRAAMAYALVVYVMTGTKMTFKSAVATQHYKIMCQLLKKDMPQLMFANHMKYMVRRYGPKRGKK